VVAGQQADPSAPAGVRRQRDGQRVSSTRAVPSGRRAAARLTPVIAVSP
jgi:hypothetical protein